MFSNCSCASKWEWVSKSGSDIALVGRRHEKLVGHLKFCSYVQFLIIFLTTVSPNGDILFSIMREATLRRKNTSGAGSKSLFFKLPRNPNSDILFSIMREATLRRKNTSGAGSESL